MEELKKKYGGERHEEVCTRQMNEGGQNKMSPFNEPISPTTVGPEMDAQVPGDGVEAFPGMHTEQAEMELEVRGDGVEAFPAMHTEGAEMEAELPVDGVAAFPAMEIEGAEIDTSVGDKQVHQQPHKVPTSEDVKVLSLKDAVLPTPEDGDGFRVICKTILHLLGDWNKTENEGVGGKRRPPMKTNLTLVGDEGNKEASATVKKQDAGGKGCRLKRPATTLLSPFIYPYRKKGTVTVLDAQTPEAYFDPTKPVAMDDVKAVIQVCMAWKTDISAELELEPFEVGADFFYKLVDETARMSSRHLDMAMFLIRKRQLSHPQVFGTEWTTADFAIQQFLQPFTTPLTKRVTRKQAASTTVYPPPHYIRNIHHFVHDSWTHGYAQAWMKVRKVYVPYNLRQCHWVAVEIDFVKHTVTVYDLYTSFTSNTMLVRYMEPITHTLAQVLYEMRFYEISEVEVVTKKGIDMSKFNPFTI